MAVLGLTAYRTAFDRPKASAGRQADDLGPAELWVAPNPSGLNAHETLDSLAATLPPHAPRWRRRGVRSAADGQPGRVDR